MNYKRALGFAAGLYVFSFIIGLTISFLWGPSLGATGASSTFIGIQLLIAFALSFVASWWYFSSPTTVASIAHGVAFGAFVVAAAFVFDLVFFIPGLLSGYTFAELIGFYADLWFWVAIFVALLGAGIAGFLRARTSGGVTGMSL